MSEFDMDAIRTLGRIEQMVMDLRAEAPKQNDAIQRLGDRTGAIERQMMARHRENGDRFDLLQATVETIKAGLAALGVRVAAVEKPVAATTDRKTTRRKWIMRGVRIIASIGAGALVFVEPAGRAVVEFYTRRFLDRP